MTTRTIGRRSLLLASIATVAVGTTAGAMPAALPPDPCIRLAARYRRVYGHIDRICKIEDAQMIAERRGKRPDPGLQARCDRIRARINAILSDTIDQLAETEATTPAGAIAKLRIFADCEDDEDLIASAIEDLERLPLPAALVPPATVAPALATWGNTRAALQRCVEEESSDLDEATVRALCEAVCDLDHRITAFPAKSIADVLAKLDVIDGPTWDNVAEVAADYENDLVAHARLSVRDDLVRLAARERHSDTA